MKTSLLAAIDTAESEADTLELPPVPEFGSVGIKVVSPKTREDAQAVGQFFNAVAEQSISHIDQPLLATALAGAQKRPLGEAWAWARRGVSVGISPLVAATNARWGLGVEVEDDADPLDNSF